MWLKKTGVAGEYVGTPPVLISVFHTTAPVAALKAVIVPSPWPSKIIPSPKASPRPFPVDANPRLGPPLISVGVVTHFSLPVAASEADGAPRLAGAHIVAPPALR